MLDPISWLALAIFGGGLVSTGVKIAARSDAKAAYGRMRDAFNGAKAQYNDTTEALNDLAAERQAVLGWVYPLSERAIARVGLSRRAYDPSNGVFGGRTMSQMRALLVKLRRTIVPPANVFDTTVALTSGGALLIEGVQYLDGIGVVHAPIFHQTLNEVLAGVTGDSVDHFSNALGGLGDLGVAELFGDALAIFSALKLGYNIFRINELGDLRLDYDQRAERASNARYQLHKLEQRALEVRSAVLNNSYDAYRWSIIAEAALEAKARGSSRFVEAVRAQLERALRAWWGALETSVSHA